VKVRPVKAKVVPCG